MSATTDLLVWIDCEMTGLDPRARRAHRGRGRHHRLRVERGRPRLPDRHPAERGRPRRHGRVRPRHARDLGSARRPRFGGRARRRGDARPRVHPALRPGRRIRAARPATRSAPIGHSSRATCRRSTRTCTTGASTCRRSRSSPSAGTRVCSSTRRRSTAATGHSPTSGSRSASSSTYRRGVFVEEPGPVVGAGEGDLRSGHRGVLRATVSRRAMPYNGSVLPRPVEGRDGHGGCSSVGRALACGAGGRGFKSRQPPQS